MTEEIKSDESLPPHEAAVDESLARAGEPLANAPVEAPAVEGASVESDESSIGEQGEAGPALDQVNAATAEEAPEVLGAGQPVVGEDDVSDEVGEDDGEAEVLVVAPAGPIEELSDEELEEDVHLDWYILKVQSNRERTSSEALKRKVAIEGLDRYFSDIVVPTEKVTEFKNGKKKTVERKIWPGYIAVRMHVNDDTWFAIRETSGIGDFTGASGKPIPMTPSDVEKILPKEVGDEAEDDAPKLNIKFTEGDKVKVTDGNFENFEGDVDSIDQQSGKITVMISIFGRSTPVELEYWQVEKL